MTREARVAPERPPKVSVIIAFLNGENFLAEAVASVFDQNFSDWELILVDDGSVDRSSQDAQTLAEQHERVSYATHPQRANRGLAESRVLGSSLARGEYLMFLDHDDKFLPRALETLCALLDAHPNLSAAFAGTLFWAFDPSLGEKDAASSYGRLGVGVTSGKRMLRDLVLSDARHPAICSSMFRRSAYLAAREGYPAYPGVYEDTALLMQLLTRGDVFLTNETVSAYRLHAGSMCHRAKAAGELADRGYSRDRARFLRWVAAHVRMDAPSRALLSVVLAAYSIRR